MSKTVSGVYFTEYGSSGKKRKSKRKQKTRAELEHEKFLKSVGAYRPRPGRASMPNNKVSDEGVAPCSNDMTGHTHKNRICDREESRETLDEIAAKQKRVAPLYNKGGLQYITDRSDKKSIGVK